MIQRFLGATALLVVLSSPALAQDAAGSPARDAPILQALPNAAENAPKTVTEFVEGQVEGQFVASDLLGRTLYNLEGTEIGVIDDLSIDEARQVALVVVDVGSLIGGDKKVAFDFDSLGYMPTDDDIRVVAAVDRDVLAKAPSFTSLADAASLGDSQGLSEGADEAKPVDEVPPAHQ
jgi:sporulation protein YlmC with PRC-barrel domain